MGPLQTGAIKMDPLPTGTAKVGVALLPIGTRVVQTGTLVVVQVVGIGTKDLETHGTGTREALASTGQEGGGKEVS